MFAIANSVDDFSEIIVCAGAQPDSNRQLHPRRLTEHLLESVNTAKPSDVNSCVLHQTQNPSGLIQVPRRWLRVKRLFAIANRVDNFSEIIVRAGA
jgi:hypothetical protein